MASSIESAAAQLAGLRAAGQLERALGAPEGTFDVGHHRQVAGPAAHPAGRPQLAQGLGPLAGVIGGDAGGLTHDRDPRRPLPGEPGVLERLLRILVDQHAGGHQMPRHLVGEVLLQATEVPAGLGVELARGDRLVQRRLGQPRRAVGIVPGRRRGGRAAAGRAADVAAGSAAAGRGGRSSRRLPPRGSAVRGRSSRRSPAAG